MGVAEGKVGEICENKRFKRYLTAPSTLPPTIDASDTRPPLLPYPHTLPPSLFSAPRGTAALSESWQVWVDNPATRQNDSILASLFYKAKSMQPQRL